MLVFFLLHYHGVCIWFLPNTQFYVRLLNDEAVLYSLGCVCVCVYRCVCFCAMCKKSLICV